MSHTFSRKRCNIPWERKVRVVVVYVKRVAGWTSSRVAICLKITLSKKLPESRREVARRFRSDLRAGRAAPRSAAHHETNNGTTRCKPAQNIYDGYDSPTASSPCVLERHATHQQESIIQNQKQNASRWMDQKPFQPPPPDQSTTSRGVCLVEANQSSF